MGGLLRLVAVLSAFAGARAGEFGLETWNTAPATIIAGQRDVLLRIRASHPGTPGAPGVELTSLGLLFESISGVPFLAQPAGNLVSAIEVFADTDGSGGFAPSRDTLIAVIIAPMPGSDGTLRLPFHHTDPADVRIGAGLAKEYFVVVRFTAGAAGQTPHTLRLTHLTNGVAATTAREAGTETPLTLLPVADVSTSVVTAVSNTPPTTSGLANRFSFDPASSPLIQLSSAFQDAEDAAGGLHYEIAGIGNPGLFSFVGIDSRTGMLALDFALGMSGASDFTIRATDSAGQTVSATSKVTLAKFGTFADWAAFQARGGNSVGTAGGEGIASGGVSSFMKYAFALDPLGASDSEGLPRVERIGNVSMFTHLKPKYATDVAYSYEISTDLATWQTAAHGEQFFQHTKDLSDGRLRVELLLLGKPERAFLRVHARPLLGTYENWAAYHFGGGNPAGSAAGDDPSGRGLTNLAKYAFTLDPQKADDRAGLPRLDKIGTAWVFGHRRPKYATDLAYSYEISSDLATWVAATAGVHFQQRTTELPEGQVREELQLLVDWPRAFLRVRANQIAPASPTPGITSANASAPAAPIVFPPNVAAPGATGSGLAGVGVGQPIRGTAIFLEETMLTTAASYANAVAVADFDGDGFPDVVSASLLDNKVAWYRSKGDGSFSAQQIITTQNVEPSAVAAADLDGDGKPDVVTGSHFPFPSGKLAWHKNLGAGNFGPQQIISTGYAYISSIAVGDLDNDGKPDVVCTGLFDNQIAWHRNLGGGLFGPNQVIGVLSGPTGAIGPFQAVIADIDGDGARDIVSASSTDNKVAWYRNSGNGTFGSQYVISTSVVRASTVAAADFDGDGRIDVVAGGANDNTVSFFKNNADGTFGSRVILTSVAKGVFSVIAADINGDGAPEVISASVGDDTIAWHENLGFGTFGPRQGISTTALGAVAVATGDFNGDGTMDVVSASQSDSKIAAYLNSGSQAVIVTNDIAPPGIVEGAQGGILRIAITNHGQPGNNSARLGELALLFESAPGTPLTTVEANALIDSVQVYADANTSGAFEVASDPLVETVLFLPLASGILQMSLPAGSPYVQVPPGTTRSFFVVVTMNANATAQALHTFRITNRMTGAVHTNARDAVSGVSLLTQAASDTASSMVVALVNQAPVTAGIPPSTVFDTIAPTSIPLTIFFNDAEDSPASLKFAIVGNSNPGLLSFAAINPASGVLLLKYRNGIPGAAQLTIQARDAGGKSVSTVLGINVKLIASLSDWMSRYGDTGLARTRDAVSDLQNYAFALDPTVAGGGGGMPKLLTQGRARVLGYVKPKYAADLDYSVEISADLMTWLPAIQGVHYMEFTTDLPNALQRKESVILVDWPDAFFRVRTELLP